MNGEGTDMKVEAKATATAATSAQIACVGAAVATREAAIGSAVTAHASAVSAAYSTRANELAGAYSNTTTKTLQVGIKTAWADFCQVYQICRGDMEEKQERCMVSF